MHVAWMNVAVAGLFGGLLALERRAFLQAMLSRPLVAATLTGALVDDVTSGLFVGMVLELFFLGSASLGAAVPHNDTLAATGTAAGAAALSAGYGESTPAIWALALLVFAGLGPVGRKIDRLLDRHSGRLNRTALSSADEGNLRRAVRQNLWGMYPHFLVFGAITALCYLAGALLSPLLESLLSPRVARGLTWAYPAMASVAAAIAAKGSNARRAHVWAGTSAVVVTSLAALLQIFRGGIL